MTSIDYHYKIAEELVGKPNEDGELYQWRFKRRMNYQGYNCLFTEPYDESICELSLFNDDKENLSIVDCHLCKAIIASSFLDNLYNLAPDTMKELEAKMEEDLKTYLVTPLSKQEIYILELEDKLGSREAEIKDLKERLKLLEDLFG